MSGILLTKVVARQSFRTHPKVNQKSPRMCLLSVLSVNRSTTLHSQHTHQQEELHRAPDERDCI